MFKCRQVIKLAGSGSIFFKIALQDQDDWPNGIFENSHFAHFAYHPDEGKLSIIAKHHEMPKFRKCKVSSEDHVMFKIEEYIEKIKKNGPLKYVATHDKFI